jgi:hypothetical protein
LVVGIILLFVGTSILPSTSQGLNQNSSERVENEIVCNSRDELDQYQTIIEAGYALFYNSWLAQSFTPSVEILTRIELAITRDSLTSYPLKISIRDDLYGDDIVCVTKQADEFPIWPPGETEWTEIDFPDIFVVPEKTYYIICITNQSLTDCYNWWGDGYSDYERGSAYYSSDFGAFWVNSINIDYCFITYGLSDNPPSPPIISGPHYGKINTNYTFSLGDITDPDGDQLYGYWSWGDGTGGWFGPYDSGQIGSASHAWSEPGNYSIRVKIKDIWGVESDWSAPFHIEIVQLKTRLFLGTFDSINQTEDLIILHIRSFIVFPSLPIINKGGIIVLSKDLHGYLGTSCTLGLSGVAII